MAERLINTGESLSTTAGGRGEMAALVRAKDWSRTRLGPCASWPVALRVIVDTILAQPLPITVLWGPDLVQIYNDGFREFAGEKHPGALGEPVADWWTEAMEVAGPVHARVLRGESVYLENQPLTLQRKGMAEQAYVSLSYSPVRGDAGNVEGIMCVVKETTQQVAAEQARGGAEAQREALLKEVESERSRLADAFAQSPAFLAVLRGPEHVFEFVNERYQELTGHREMVGKPIREAMPEIRGQGYYEILDQVYSSGTPFVGHNMLIRLRRQAGAPLEDAFVDFVYQPMRDAAGAVVGILLHGVDVTGRRAAEQDLVRTTERLELAQRAAGIGVFDWDVRTGQVYWSEQEQRLFGLEPGAFEGTIAGWSARLLPEDGAAVQEQIARAMAQGIREIAFEFRILRADGAVRHLEGSGRFVYGLGGEPLRMVGVNIDVTERKLAEAAARRDVAERQRTAERISRLYSVAAALSEAMTIDQVARVTVDEGLRALGASAGSLLLLAEDGVTLEMAAHTGYDESVIAPWRRIPLDAPVPLTDAVRQGEAIFLRSNEERLTRYPALVRVTASTGTRSSACLPLMIGEKAVGVLGLGFAHESEFLSDDREFVMTLARQCAQAIERARLFEAERKARAEAERANEAKSEFLAVLSHELRTPLTPVLLTVSLMEANPELPESLREDVATIKSNVELESRLIGDLLDLTRISKGKLQLDMQDVDLHLIIRSAIAICQREASAQLVVDLRAPRATVRGDSTRLQQIFWNLISNAQKFTPPEGTITIRSSEAGEGWIRVDVVDTGVGIDPAVLPKLFTAFEQGEIRALRQQAGLGLGLAISKRLTEAHGGTIAARSAGKGWGATFRVELPVVRVFVAERLPAPAAPSAATVRPLAVLLVEDHAPTLKIMARLLGQLGHKVSTATTAAAAIAAAQQQRYDVLISDLGLPDGSGLDVMRELRDQYAGRAIALTGYGMESDVAASRDAGFARHLTKPVDMEKLQWAIGELVGNGSRT